MSSTSKRWFGHLGTAGAVVAATLVMPPVLAVTAPGAPALVASPSTTADKPVVLVPGESPQITVVVRNTQRSTMPKLKATLINKPTSAAFKIAEDGCTGRSLGRKGSCRVLVRYTAKVAPAADATAALKVATARTSKHPSVSTTTYLKVDAAQLGPAAADDSYTLGKDGLTVPAPGVLGNDIDPRGGALAAQSAEGPAHGTLTLNSDGSFGYLPTAGFTGSDSFTYRAIDDTGRTALATVRLTVSASNTAPLATVDATSVDEDGAPVSGNVLANDTDSDGDTLSVTNAGTLTTTYGSLVLNADGTFTYTLDNSNATVDALNTGQTLSDTTSYTIADGQGHTATAALNVTINGTTDVLLNRAPTGNHDSVSVTEDGATFYGDVLANDTDPDGDTISVDDATGGLLSYGSFTLAANGGFSYTVNNLNHEVDSLNAGETLTDSFAYVVVDEHGAHSGVTSVSITIHGVTDPA